MNRDNIQVGDTDCYIHDFAPVKRLCEIPANVAALWIATACPETVAGSIESQTCKNLMSGIDLNGKPYVCGWMNKRFIVVSVDSFRPPVALYNHDDSFYVYEILPRVPS